MGKKFKSWEELSASRRLRCRIEYAGLAAAAALVPRLPRSWLRGFASIAARLVYTFDQRGRRYALANLRMVYGAEKSEAELAKIAVGSYRQFACTMLELFWSRNFAGKNFAECAEFEGWEHLRAATAGGGVIGFCLHYGNFEWLSLSAALQGYRGIIVTQQFRNPLLGPIFDRLRAIAGHRVIQQERSILATLKHLKTGGSVGILTDLQLDPSYPSTPVRSFGRWCSMTKMHAILHKRTGLPLVPMECVPLPDGRYKMIVHEPMTFGNDVTEQEIAQRCWDVLEPQLRRQPEAWLWAYKHWRHLPPGEDVSDYPFYAGRSREFDELFASEVAGSSSPENMS